MKASLQAQGLYTLAALGALILILLGYTFWLGAQHITHDGKVPVGDAATFTGLILAFREVLAVIRSLWDSNERSVLTEKLADSAPPSNDPQPVVVTNQPDNAVPTVDT